MRHFRVLCDDALESLADIFMTIEGLAAFPSQVVCVFVLLIPKPKGGNRPSGNIQVCTACGARFGAQRQGDGKR